MSISGKDEPKDKTKMVSFRLDKELWDDVGKWALSESKRLGFKVSKTDIVRRALRNYVPVIK